MYFRSPTGEEWNCSLQIEQRALLKSVSGTGSRKTPLAIQIFAFDRLARINTPEITRQRAVACCLPRRGEIC
jgi:hypothetical protein